MFAYIKGKITFKFENRIIIEAAGIGYEVFAAENEISNMTCSEEDILLFTKMIFKEDDVSIYGFLNRDSLEVFNKLISVNGVGAKAGISILSSLPLEELTRAIMLEEFDKLTKAQGIGKKIAQRIILELKDKISNISLSEQLLNNNSFKANSPQDEAIIALISLGYSKFEATQAVTSIATPNTETEKLVKLALQNLLRR